MKMNRWMIALPCLAAFPLVAPGQVAAEEDGFNLGSFNVVPQVRVLGGYDRQEHGSGDYYGETEASARFQNAEARYRFGGDAHYGYRAYDEHSTSNDDFYGANGRMSFQQSLFSLAARATYQKTVDYDTVITGGSGEDLGSVLTASTSARTSAQADLGYEKQITDRSALMPGYSALYYHQTFDGRSDIEWYEQMAVLRLGYSLSEQTLLTLEGSYSFQYTDTEDGTIANASIGAKSRYSEKINWTALIGFSAADYEVSGSDQGLEGSLNVQWRITDKIATYVFAESKYQPGTASDGARQVYRVGYGGSWAFIERLRFDLQFLHDRQEFIQTSAVEASHFATAQLEYDVARNVTLALSGRYIAEEGDADRGVVSLGAIMTF